MAKITRSPSAKLLIASRFLWPAMQIEVQRVRMGATVKQR